MLARCPAHRIASARPRRNDRWRALEWDLTSFVCHNLAQPRLVREERAGEPGEELRCTRAEEEHNGGALGDKAPKKSSALGAGRLAGTARLAQGA